jgi:hypothetical protein
MEHDTSIGWTGDEQQRQTLLEAIADAYEKLAADPDAYEQELKDRQSWDSTLTDGLR